MNPKKYKDNIPAVAEMNNLDEMCTRDIVDFYWKEVRKAASELKSPRLQVQGLGYFQVYKTRLKVRISEVSKFFLIPPDQMTFQRHAVKIAMEKTLDITKKMQAMLDEDTERLQIFKELKYGENIKRGLEKPQKYSRRDIEQLVKKARDRKHSEEENGRVSDLPDS